MTLKHLDERKVDNLHQAATMADDYALTHKFSFVKKGMENTSFDKNKLGLNKPAIFYDPSKGSSTLGSIDKDKSSYNTSGGSSMTNKGLPSAIPMCAYCKKKRHLMSECWTLKRKEERRSQLSSNACTAVKSTLKPVYLENSEVEVKRSESEFIKEEFKPFVSEGFVSLKGNANLHPIKIMRDTGASQSLLLEGILPLSEETSAGASVLIQGVELGFIKVPLHVVELKSDFVCGSVTVGVRPTLPIEGVSLLLGNDLAGDKVIVNPIVSDKPCFEDDCEEQGNAEIFPACAVTRAMEKTFSEEETVDQDDHLNMIAEIFEERERKRYEDKLDERDYNSDVISKEKLIGEQEKDPELLLLSQKALSSEEEGKTPVCYFKQDGMLMRKWRPPDALLHSGLESGSPDSDSISVSEGSHRCGS